MAVALPQPSKLLALVSLLVIACNLFAISAVTGLIIGDPNPISIMGGFFFLPPSIVIAIQQYRGTFHRSAGAAKTTAVIMYCIGVFLVFGVITSAGEALSDGTPIARMLPFLRAMYGFAACAVVVGLVNRAWSRQLQSAIAVGATAPTRRTFTIRGATIAIGVLAVITTATWQFALSVPPKWAEHVDAAAGPGGLPLAATDISYCRGARGTIAYEFTIDEPGFRNWFDSGIGSIESESAEVPLTEIRSEITFERYGILSPEPGHPDEITISAGLHYGWEKEDRGVYAAFDRTTHRAYYFAHFH